MSRIRNALICLLYILYLYIGGPTHLRQTLPCHTPKVLHFKYKCGGSLPNPSHYVRVYDADNEDTKVEKEISCPQSSWTEDTLDITFEAVNIKIEFETFWFCESDNWIEYDDIYLADT